MALPTRRARGALAGLLLACASALTPLPIIIASAPAGAWAAEDVTFDTAPLTILTTDGKRHPLTVELALDSAQRAQGLMFRQTMAADRGMLFDFGTTRRVMMWMKNTDLPLDMLFVSKEGKVETLHENAIPQSEAIIDSVVPVAYVLELNAGTIKSLRITPGARLESPQIGPTARPAKAD